MHQAGVLSGMPSVKPSDMPRGVLSGVLSGLLGREALRGARVPGCFAAKTLSRAVYRSWGLRRA